jgi:hypothetical protein
MPLKPEEIEFFIDPDEIGVYVFRWTRATQEFDQEINVLARNAQSNIQGAYQTTRESISKECFHWLFKHFTGLTTALL